MIFVLCDMWYGEEKSIKIHESVCGLNFNVNIQQLDDVELHVSEVVGGGMSECTSKPIK
jgi:hypothetical protein